jgi:C4-dicarboxylate transporter DctQ subunit
MTADNRLLKFVGKATLALETFLVTTCLGAMVIIVLCQIFMRNVFDSGFVVGDSMVKHLVLWVTFLGAGLASKKRGHIRIDVADKLFTGRAKTFIEAVVTLFSSSICAILSHASYNFVMMEYESNQTFGMTDIPVWLLESIIPVGFAIIALRFFINFITAVKRTVKPT